MGKTGTFAYLGAMIGMGIIYLPIANFEYFHNDSRKREFVSAGLACGMAVAFGSPIGGTLFGYELSQPNFFWEVQSTWRTFIACTISVIFYSLMYDIYKHGDISEWVLDSTPLKFDTSYYSTPTFQALPAALIIGSICGLVGAAFVSANTYVNMFRIEYLSSQHMKVVEIALITLATTTFAFWLPYFVNSECYSSGSSDDKQLV